MAPKIVVTHWVHEDVLAYLARHGQVVSNPGRTGFAPDVLAGHLADADAALVFMPDCVDAALLDGCPRLRVVAGAFKGFDNIDLVACARRGVWVTFVPDLLTEPTAELAVALMLSLTRQVLPGDRCMRSGAFTGWSPRFYAFGMTGRVVGVVGMGAVGRAVARRLAGFGVTLLYADPQPLAEAQEAELRARRLPLEELLAAADIVVLAAPLTPATFHLLGRDRVRLLKPGGYLVNVGRGSVVDEEAVAERLASGQLAGYAADVYALEDLSRPDRPRVVPPGLLAAQDRTVLTPHLGSAVDDVRRAIALAAAQSIVEVLAGRVPANAANRPQRPR
jgi:phosphonate dehydrogenase